GSGETDLWQAVSTTAGVTPGFVVLPTTRALPGALRAVPSRPGSPCRITKVREVEQSNRRNEVRDGETPNEGHGCDGEDDGAVERPHNDREEAAPQCPHHW